MLVLYAAWSSLLCNLDFSCFKSLYYVPFTLVVLVCCSLPLLSSLNISSLFFFSNCNFNYERERESVRNTCQTISYRQIVFRLPFAHTHTHPINTANRGEFVKVKHESADTVNTEEDDTTIDSTTDVGDNIQQYGGI